MQFLNYLQTISTWTPALQHLWNRYFPLQLVRNLYNSSASSCQSTSHHLWPTLRRIQWLLLGFCCCNLSYNPNTTHSNTEGICSYSGSQSTFHPTSVLRLQIANSPQSTPNPQTKKWHEVPPRSATTTHPFTLLLPYGHLQALQQYPPLPISTTQSLTCIINVPAKIWQPKPKDQFLTVDYATEYDDSVLIFDKFGRAITHLDTEINVPTCINIWVGNQTLNHAEFIKNFNIGTSVHPHYNPTDCIPYSKLLGLLLRWRCQTPCTPLWICCWHRNIKTRLLPITMVWHLWTSHHAGTTWYSPSQWLNRARNWSVGINDCSSPKTSSGRSSKH